MKKFTDISREELVTEEFLNLFKKSEKSPGEWIKTSLSLLKGYCDNLLSENFLSLLPGEEEHFDFKFYKIKSITKEEPHRWTVVISTYDQSEEFLEDVIWKLEI